MPKPSCARLLIEDIALSTPLPPANRNDDGRGSLWLGFGLAWAALAGGYFAAGILASALASAHGLNSDAVIVVLILAPWLLMLGLIVWFAANKRPRMRV